MQNISIKYKHINIYSALIVYVCEPSVIVLHEFCLLLKTTDDESLYGEKTEDKTDKEIETLPSIGPPSILQVNNWFITGNFFCH